MKSVKPGRGPSMMGGIFSAFAALFGVFWMIMASSMGAGFMSLFGLIFIAIAIIQAVYHFKNATSENRYSTFDIVDASEESDPFHVQLGNKEPEKIASDCKFCPYCGTAVEEAFEYCHKCGKRLP